MNSGGLPLQQALKVKAGLGLVEEDDLHVDVIPGGVEEVGLKQVESLLHVIDCSAKMSWWQNGI